MGTIPVVFLGGDGVLASKSSFEGAKLYSTSRGNYYQDPNILRMFSSIVTLGCEFRFLVTAGENLQSALSLPQELGLPAWASHTLGDSPAETFAELSFVYARPLAWVSSTTESVPDLSPPLFQISTKGKGLRRVHMNAIHDWVRRSR